MHEAFIFGYMISFTEVLHTGTSWEESSGLAGNKMTPKLFYINISTDVQLLSHVHWSDK